MNVNEFHYVNGSFPYTRIGIKGNPDGAFVSLHFELGVTSLPIGKQSAIELYEYMKAIVESFGESK
jgi:hypothetical protein